MDGTDTKRAKPVGEMPARLNKSLRKKRVNRKKVLKNTSSIRFSASRTLSQTINNSNRSSDTKNHKPITIKTHHIYAGNCVDVMTKLPSDSIDLIFADPPYNLSGKNLKLIGNKTGGDFYMVNEAWDKMSDEDYDVFTHKWINCCHVLLREGGTAYVCCTLHNIASVINALKQSGMTIRNIITWYKTNAMPSITKRTFTHSTEFIIYATKNSKWIFNYDDLKKINPEKQKNGDLKQMRDVWSIPIAQGKQRIRQKNGKALHPTQKPEELVKRAIIASSNEGDLVLDPFMGSGTTAVVAERYSRKWIGIETNKIYRKHAQLRINNLKSNS